MAEKNKRHFNIIDVLVIAVVLALLAGIAIRYDIAGKLGIMQEKDKVVISFLIEGIKPTSAQAINSGDKFYIISSSTELGSVLSTTTSPAEVYNMNSDGEVILSYDSERVDVRGEIEAYGTITDNGFMLGGTEYLGANKVIYVKSQNIMVNIRITGIREA